MTHHGPCRIDGIMSRPLHPLLVGLDEDSLQTLLKRSARLVERHFSLKRGMTMTWQIHTLKLVTPSTTVARTYSFSFAPSSSFLFLSSLTRTLRGGDLIPLDQMAWLSPGEIRTSLTPIDFWANWTTALMAFGDPGKGSAKRPDISLLAMVCWDSREIEERLQGLKVHSLLLKAVPWTRL